MLQSESPLTTRYLGSAGVCTLAGVVTAASTNANGGEPLATTTSSGAGRDAADAAGALLRRMPPPMAARDKKNDVRRFMGPPFQRERGLAERERAGRTLTGPKGSLLPVVTTIRASLAHHHASVQRDQTRSAAIWYTQKILSRQDGK